MQPHPAKTDAVLPARKPRLLFFQWDHSPHRGLSEYLLLHMNAHVQGLSEFFQVTVVNRDCDYVEMCDRHEPELALFESGHQTFVSRRPNIRNVRVDNGVPRIGFHNADSWSDCRSGFLSDMEQWGIETYFSICATTHEYMPCIRDRTYIWPNYLDPAVFRDYGLAKVVPVMISGQCHEQYPWREEAFPFIGRMFPSIICPTFHNGSALSTRTLTGEAYARALNASLFSPTCGTIAGEVVRKHLEIPGAKACLVTQDSRALREAGFVHMENCVFAEPRETVEAIDALMRAPDELDRITANGFALVHSRHTARQRPQIYQWFSLQAGLAPGERIVQRGPFADLVVERGSAAQTAPFVSIGRFSALLRRANADLWAGRPTEARQGFEACLRYVRYLPEARFGLALCDLEEGKPAAASAILADLIEASVAVYGAADPDPLEWTYYVVSVLAQGDIDKARELCGWYPGLRHRQRGYVERAIAICSGRPVPSDAPAGDDRKSIHWAPPQSYDEWWTWLAGLLRRAGHPDLAECVLDARRPAPPPEADVTGSRPDARRLRDSALKAADRALQLPGLARYRPKVPPNSDFRYLSLVAGAVKARLTRGDPGVWLRTRLRRRRARAEADQVRLQRHSDPSLVAVAIAPGRLEPVQGEPSRGIPRGALTEPQP